MTKFSIFLSHRSKDALVAGELRAILEGLDDSDVLRVIVSENIPKGEDWRTSIHTALASADRFLLLYTDPSQKWDWCLYESGFFSGARLIGVQTAAKFITLHAVDVEPPSPLSNWQTVRGDANSVLQLLRELFCDTLRDGASPIAPKLKDNDRLKVAADRIATLIRPGPKPDWYTNFIRLVMAPKQVEDLTARRSVPADAVVESDDLSLGLFNVKRGAGLTWGRMLAGWQDPEKRELLAHWCRGLSEALCTAVAGARSLPQLPLFYSYDNRCYHSFLQRLDKMPDGSHRGYVVFTEFHAEDDPRPPGDLGVLTHMLTLGRNFRWGVVEPFIQKFELLIARGCSPDVLADEICKLESAIARALSDGARANLLSPEIAVAIFADPEDRAKIAGVYAEWQTMVPGFNEAMAQRNLNETLRVLREFRRLNTNFLSVAAKRLHEVLSPPRPAARPFANVGIASSPAPELRADALPSIPAEAGYLAG